MAISETSLKDVALMTIEEINEAGGVLGRKLEPVVVDPASNWPLFAEKAKQLLSVDNVCKSFPKPDGGELLVLDGVNLRLVAGQIVGLLGRSGSGKSTLLRLIAGLTEPSAGALSFRGEPILLGQLDIDHVIPYSYGGATNRANLLPATSFANRSRRNSLEILRQLIAGKLLLSAFYHRFVLTRHSPIGRNPELYGIRAVL